MIFDRISLVKSYAGLKVVELNDGKVKDILFNKTAYYGTKTVRRFNTLKDLGDFIDKNYPYQYFDPDCQCAVTGKEAIWTPLSFNLTLPNNRYATFVNNMRGEFESAQGDKLNKLSVDACTDIFKNASDLERLKVQYSCFEYVVNQQQYVAPCEYVELIVNDAYTQLVKKYYPLSKNTDLTAFELLVSQDPVDVLPDPIIPELVITTTTTTAAPTTTTTTTEPQCPDPIAVEGYYPLYETEECANQHAGGNGSSHTHDLGNPVTTYYMPNGLTLGVDMFHGDYQATTTTSTTTTTTTAAPTTTTTTAAPTTTTTTAAPSPSPSPYGGY